MDRTQRFKTGDIVQLNSGGPNMTVQEKTMTGDSVRCQWFSGKKLETGVFKFESLVRPKEAEKKG